MRRKRIRTVIAARGRENMEAGGRSVLGDRDKEGGGGCERDKMKKVSNEMLPLNFWLGVIAYE